MAPPTRKKLHHVNIQDDKNEFIDELPKCTALKQIWHKDNILIYWMHSAYLLTGDRRA